MTALCDRHGGGSGNESVVPGRGMQCLRPGLHKVHRALGQAQLFFSPPCRFSLKGFLRKFLSHGPDVIPKVAQEFLAISSSNVKTSRSFKCIAFNSEWDQFVENWVPILHSFLIEALGPFGREPLPIITQLSDGAHMSGATASFNMGTGQVQICQSVEGNPGQTLEKLTHELVHGSLAQFPSIDPFYDEGFVDYSTWVLCHAPIYGELRDQAVAAAAYNISMRRERAMRDLSDYDRKRWAGGVFVNFAFGPMVLHKLRMKKAEGDFTW